MKEIGKIIIFFTVIIIFMSSCNLNVRETIPATQDPITTTESPEPPATAAPIPTHTPIPPPTSANTPVPSPTLSIGSSMVNPIDGMTLLYVPAGEFVMGSWDGELDERPVHTVYLDAFWINKTEVTNAMFVEFLNAMGNQSEGGFTWLNAANSYSRIFQSGENWVARTIHADHPVVEVSWYGARAYCEWAGQRLPTEAEWEKAARGVDDRSYPWGEGIDCSLAHYVDCGDYTVPIGSFPDGASPYGVLDMAGNAFEWVADWYGSDYYEISPSENPTGPTSGTFRVLRGGGGLSHQSYLRVSFRSAAAPYSRTSLIGFRCASSQP